MKLINHETKSLYEKKFSYLPKIPLWSAILTAVLFSIWGIIVAAEVFVFWWNEFAVWFVWTLIGCVLAAIVYGVTTVKLVPVILQTEYLAEIAGKSEETAQTEQEQQ